ncbi:MAG: OmpH family outer membrane protein [Acidobacteria bacterium]|nr:OmpH family outer membrane protein [Acidobacteriota bacterium]
MTFKILSVVPALAAMSLVQAQSKVGIIHIQNAIIATKDGQKAAAALQAKFDPKRKDLEKKQGDLAAKQQELNRGSNTMAEARRTQLARDIDQLQKSLQRETEDAQAELEQEQNKLLNEIGQKLMVVLEKYAKDNAYTLILDISSQQTPVLYAATGVEISKDIVDMYDKNAPGGAPAPAPLAPPPAKKVPGAK